jgi:hypothetical protein
MWWLTLLRSSIHLCLVELWNRQEMAIWGRSESNAAKVKMLHCNAQGATDGCVMERFKPALTAEAAGDKRLHGEWLEA